MFIPTKPIGSIPRPSELNAAVRDTITRFEATGSPVATDGEQRKYRNFWGHCVHGLPSMAPDGFKTLSTRAIPGGCRASLRAPSDSAGTPTATPKLRGGTRRCP